MALVVGDGGESSTSATAWRARTKASEPIDIERDLPGAGSDRLRARELRGVHSRTRRARSLRHAAYSPPKREPNGLAAGAPFTRVGILGSSSLLQLPPGSRAAKVRGAGGRR